jgi:hypothetical protein
MILMQNIVFQVIVFIVSIYVMLEALHAIMRMDGGDRLCRVLKYISTVIASGLVMESAYYKSATLNEFLSILSIALFLWPTMIYRWRGEYRNRVGDK